MDATADQDQWTDDKQKQLMDFLAPGIQQGANMNVGAPSTPPAGGSPPPPQPDMAKANESASQGSTEPAAKTVDSHPGLSPEQNDKLLQYVQGQQQQVDKFGPDQQKAVMDMIAQQQNGIPNKIGRALSGWADATATGVGRSANPGFAERYDARENATANRQMDLGKNLQEQNLAALKAKQGLEELSPTTPVGASSSPAIQAVAKMYGMSPQAIDAMKKSNPQTVMKLLDQVGQFATGKMKAQIDQELKLLEIQVQQSNAQAMQGIARSGKDIEAKKEQTEKDKAILGAGSPLNPFNPVTAAQKKAALSHLSGAQSEQFTPDVMAYAQKHGITPEQAQSIKDKRTGAQ